MYYIILVFGILTLLAGLVIVVKPDGIFGILRTHLESLSLHVLAVVVRIILGVALITYAADSKYPIILEILGWISLAAAIGLGIIGRAKFQSLMKWALNLGSPYGRTGGFIGILFGGFLIHAVL